MTFKNLFFLILAFASVIHGSHLNAMNQKPYELNDDYDFFLNVAHCLVHRAAHEGPCSLVSQTLKSFPDQAWEFITQPLPDECNDYFKKMNEHGFSALHWAVKGGRVNTVNFLLSWTKDSKKIQDLLLQQDRSGRTVLHLAVIYNHEAIVKQLIFPAEDREFLVNFMSIKTVSNQTALDLARLNNNSIIFQLLCGAHAVSLGEISIL